MSTGQWMRPAGGAEWFFDAGAESLDFVYAGIDDVEHLTEWFSERVERFGTDLGERDLRDAQGLRQAFIRLYAAAADEQPLPADDVDTLNLFAATPDIPPALAGGHRQAGAGSIRLGQALSTLAREAVANLSAGEGRVRHCDAADCRLVFHDESRTNNRRWCSMERCGNRAKVRAHRERAAMKRVAARAQVS